MWPRVGLNGLAAELTLHPLLDLSVCAILVLGFDAVCLIAIPLAGLSIGLAKSF